MGFLNCNNDYTITNLGQHIFCYPTDICISYYFVCDGENNCPGDDPLDERGCHCNPTVTYSSKCKYIVIDNVSIVCSSFYYKDRNEKCKMFTAFESFALENDTQTKNESHHFACNNGKVISKLLLNDFVVDCGPELEDELMLKAVLEKKCCLSLPGTTSPTL